MRIDYHKQFIKQFDRLERRDQVAVTDAIDRFRINPFDHSLHNHQLKGSMKGSRSISAGFDLRIIFQEHDGYAIVLMLAVGTHEGVY